jgi:hypothetical protein
VSVRAVSFSAHHYIDRGDEIPREKSPRQDITFTFYADSVTVTLPPPAGCVLYLDVTPGSFLRELMVSNAAHGLPDRRNDPKGDG